MATISVTFQSNPTGRTVVVDGVTRSTPYTASWESGTTHTISCASPQAGLSGYQYVFNHWSDYGSQTHTITPTISSTYTCYFDTQVYFTMSAVTPSGGGSASPASGWKTRGSYVTLSAVASYGYDFVQWHGTGTGSYSGTSSTYSLLMNYPITEQAEFKKEQVTLTINSSPTGRTVLVDGVTKTCPYSVDVDPGTSVALNCASPQAGAAGVQYLFSYWSDYGSQSHSKTINYDTTVTCYFTTQYYLTMAANPSAGGSVSPLSGWKNAGAYIGISASPNVNYDFSSWSGTGFGSYSGTTNAANITMNAPITQTANFVTDLITITFNSSPTGRTVKIDGGLPQTCPFQKTWHSGDTHSISCDSPQSVFTGTRYVWASWSDSGLQTHNVSPVANTTYTCNFTTQHYLTMKTNPLDGSGGTVTPASQWVNENTQKTIEATAASGYTFTEWQGSLYGYSGTDNPKIITILYNPVTETAVFTANSPAAARRGAMIRQSRRIPVASSFIKFIQYFEESSELHIWIGYKEFVYKDVEPEIWRQFLTAPSKGSYYDKHIKGKYSSGV